MMLASQRVIEARQLELPAAFPFAVGETPAAGEPGAICFGDAMEQALDSCVSPDSEPRGGERNDAESCKAGAVTAGPTHSDEQGASDDGPSGGSHPPPLLRVTPGMIRTAASAQVEALLGAPATEITDSMSPSVSSSETEEQHTVVMDVVLAAVPTILCPPALPPLHTESSLSFGQVIPGSNHTDLHFERHECPLIRPPGTLSPAGGAGDVSGQLNAHGHQLEDPASLNGPAALLAAESGTNDRNLIPESVIQTLAPDAGKTSVAPSRTSAAPVNLSTQVPAPPVADNGASKQGDRLPALDVARAAAEGASFEAKSEVEDQAAGGAAPVSVDKPQAMRESADPANRSTRWEITAANSPQPRSEADPDSLSPKPAATAKDASDASGIGGAESAESMSKALEKGQLRPPAEQNLPGRAVLDRNPAETAGTGEPPILEAVGPHKRSRSSILISDGVYLPSPASSATHAREVEISPTVGNASTAAVDHLQQRIVNCVVELKKLEANSIAVVIKPEAGTELSLRLQVRDGLVDVEAHCRQGDLVGLAGHWEQLQRNLSGQGIRLGALQDATQHGQLDQQQAGGHHQSSPEQRNPAPAPDDRQPRRADAVRETVTADKLQPPQPSGRAQRHWESWA